LRTEKHKVVVVGAGPAGATASIFLSKSGIDHVLLDKSFFPRDKVCGDALSGKVLPILKKIDPGIIDDISSDKEHYKGSHGIRFAAPNGKYIDIPFDRNSDFTTAPPGYISKRIDFDDHLFRLTESDHCDRREGHTLEKIERDPSTGQLDLHVKNNSGEMVLRTPLMISGEGDRSIAARQLAGHRMEPGHYCAGIRVYYKNVSDMHEHNFIELHFLKELLPGYFWIFPLPGGMANVGAGILSSRLRKNKINLKEKFKAAIEQNPTIRERFLNAEPVTPIEGWGLPLGSKRRKISGDNFMLTGDAASMIDPFTGEGISNAMYCGMMAAETAKHAISHNLFGAGFLQQYDEIVYKRLWDELRLSKTMQDLSSVPWLFNMVVNRAKSSPTLRDTISCMFDDLELRSRLRNPMFYLKLILNR
jgi:geranylgeranyl reductase family protein